VFSNIKILSAFNLYKNKSKIVCYCIFYINILHKVFLIENQYFINLLVNCIVGVTQSYVDNTPQ
jgi:hypothetical protein